MVTWMDGAVRSVVRVATGETDPDQVDLFWIRLYGVAVDVRDDLLRLEKEMRTFFPNTLAKDIEGGPVGDALALLDRLQSRLTGEEWLYVGYRRQVAAHPFQDSYGLSLKEHGTALKTEYRRPILRPGVKVTVHEEDLALNQLLASVGGDEALIPRRLALLALDDVRGLGDCLRQWLPDETVLSPSQEFEFGLDGPRKRGS
jgi:hypothetical protein